MNYSLLGKQISTTYGRLVQIASGSYYDGLGNLVNLPGIRTGSSYPITSSWAKNVVSASYARSASWAYSASHAIKADNATSSSYARSASWAYSASHAHSSSYARSASWAPAGDPSKIISGNVSASISPTGGLEVNTSASFDGNLILSGYVVNTKTPPPYSNFIGVNAGYNAVNAYDGNFIGSDAGYNATNARHGIFIGSGSGYNATDAYNGIFIGRLSGYSASNAEYGVFIGKSAGYMATNAYGSVFVGDQAGHNAAVAVASVFVGRGAGYLAMSASDGTFIGFNSGADSTNAHESVFMGSSAGAFATNAMQSTFIGMNSGLGATNATGSNFIGWSCGEGADGASYSNFLGYQAGFIAHNSFFSNFIGYQAGFGAVNANNSIFIGYAAGINDTVNNTAGNSSSILIGDYTSTGGYNNSIAIGQGVQNTQSEQVNIGNVIYVSNIYSVYGQTTGSAQPNGKVGIGVYRPVNTLDVAGHISCSVITASLFAGTASYAKQARSASWAPGSSGGTTLHTGSTYPITASWAENAKSASYLRGVVGIVDTLTANNGIDVGGMSTNVQTQTAVQLGFGQNHANNILNSVQVGYQTGQNATTANSTVQVGYQAGYSATNASYATQMGYQAGAYSTIATQATQVGYQAGRNAANATQATQVGYTAGYNAKTGSYTTFIGAGADTLNAKLNVEKSIAIGYNAKVSGSNMCVIGGTGVDAVKVGIGTTSPAYALEVVGSVKASNFTGSVFGSSSYARNARSASWAPSSGGTTLHTASTYPITSSWAANAVSATSTTTATNATSASYLLGYRDTSRLIDQSWEFFSAHQAAGIADGWNIYNGTLLNTLSATLGHPGVLRRSCGTSTTVPSVFTPGFVASPTQPMHMAWGDFRSFETILRNVQATPDHIIRIGLFSDISGAGAAGSGFNNVRGFYFERTGSVGSITGSWRYAARSASINQSFATSVKYTSGSAPAVDQWHNFQLIRNNVTNKMHYLIDGIQYGTSSYIMPLTTGYQFGIQIWSQAGLIRQFDIDWARITSYPITTVGRG